MKTIIQLHSMSILFCIIFLFQNNSIEAFFFNLQSLLPNLKKNDSLVLVQKQELWDATKQEEVSADDKGKEKAITQQLWEITKKELKPYWDMLTYEKFKELYIKMFEGQTVGIGATLQKGTRLTAKGAIDPITIEGKYRSKRMDTVPNELTKFLGYKFTDKAEVPRIGFAFSGGGYRAMVLTAGYLKALEDLNLLASTLYISTLSGSTWYLGPWTYQQGPDKKKTIAEFNQMIIDKIQNNHLNLIDRKKDFDVKQFATQVIWPKVLYDQVISSVDIYGADLAHILLHDLGSKRLITRLSHQQQSVETGNAPWPIYTAVSDVVKSDGSTFYTWYEFNPVQIRNLENDYALPSFAFGRKFENGTSMLQQGSYPLEQPFGYCMGIFGSAYTVNLNDIIRITLGIDPTGKDFNVKKEFVGWLKKAKNGLPKLGKYFNWAKDGKFKNIWEDVKGNLEEVQGSVLLSFLKVVNDNVIKKVAKKTIKVGGKEFEVGSTRFAPAQVYNPFKNFAGLDQSDYSKWLQEQEVLTFVDAGISYNIPLRPLMRPERDLDIIIIGDSSGNVPAGIDELNLALADIKRFYKVDYTKDEQMSAQNMFVYHPKQKSYPNLDPRLQQVEPGIEPPILIYFNYLKNDKLITDAEKVPALKSIVDENNLKTFDPVKCLTKGACSTFNFAYTVNDFKQLSGLAEFNVRAFEDTLRILIDEVADRRKKEEEAGIGG